MRQHDLFFSISVVGIDLTWYIGYPLTLSNVAGYTLFHEIARGETVAEKKLTRKELLNEPDEFISITGKVLKSVKDNPNVLISFVVIFVLIMVIGLGVYAYQSRKEAKGHELFLMASRNFEKEATSINQPTKETLQKLQSEFDSIAKDYSGYLSGDLSLLYSGHVSYKAEDYERALESYSKTMNTSLAKHGFAPLIQYNVAQTLFTLKNYDKALALFDQFSKDITSPYRREAHVNMARIYEALGKNKEAVQAYRQYLKIFPEAPDADFVKARIAQISTKS